MTRWMKATVDPRASRLPSSIALKPSSFTNTFSAALYGFVFRQLSTIGFTYNVWDIQWMLYIDTQFLDAHELFLGGASPQISNHKTFMGPWAMGGPWGAHGGPSGPMGPMGPYWAHGVWDHSPRAEVALRNCAQTSLVKRIEGALPRIEERGVCIYITRCPFLARNLM